MRLRHCIIHAITCMALTVSGSARASDTFDRLVKALVITGIIAAVVPPEITRNAGTYVRAANEGQLTARPVPQGPSQPVKLIMRSAAVPAQVCLREPSDGRAVAGGACSYWRRADSLCVLVAPNGQTTHHITGQLYAACLQGLI